MELIIATMTMAAWASTLSTTINNDWYILNDTKHTPSSSLCLSVDSHQFTVAYPGIGWGGGVQSLGTSGTS